MEAHSHHSSPAFSLNLSTSPTVTKTNEDPEEKKQVGLPFQCHVAAVSSGWETGVQLHHLQHLHPLTGRLLQKRLMMGIVISRTGVTHVPKAAKWLGGL